MRLAIQICAEEEWRDLRSLGKIGKEQLSKYPFGEFFHRRIGGHPCIFYHSGATKTRAAAACQFAIDHWHPEAIINIGTCGGVGKGIRKLDLILANQTFQYDVCQCFGKPSVKFRKGLKTRLKISGFDLGQVSRRLHFGTIASADRDLTPNYRKKLQRHGVLAADWESASIAKVCELNGIPCLILRGVTDIPGRSNGDAQQLDYRKNTKVIMKDLLGLIDGIVSKKVNVSLS